MKQDLGELWDWLPEGAIYHDAYAYHYANPYLNPHLNIHPHAHTYPVANSC